MASLRKLFGKLKLRVNEAKSKVSARHGIEVPRLLVLDRSEGGRSGGAWHRRPSSA